MLSEFQDSVIRNKKTTDPTKLRVLHWALGLGGEAGEALEFVKKSEFYGDHRHTHDLIKELGDVVWYVTALASEYGYELEDVLRMNMEKLQERYKDGFTKEEAVRLPIGLGEDEAAEFDEAMRKKMLDELSEEAEKLGLYEYEQQHLHSDRSPE